MAGALVRSVWSLEPKPCAPGLPGVRRGKPRHRQEAACNVLESAPPAETNIMPMPPRRPEAGALAAPRPRFVLLPSASVLAFCAYALKMPTCESLSSTCSSDERSHVRWACFSDSVAALEGTKPLANCSTTLDCLSPWPLQAAFRDATIARACLRAQSQGIGSETPRRGGRYCPPGCILLGSLSNPREPADRTAADRRKRALESTAAGTMTRPLFVAAVRQHVGKTTVSLALMNGLRKRFGKVGRPR